MITLRHDSPECTGHWDCRTTGYRMYWRCSLCGAIGRDSVENHEAAIRENIMGNTLDQLTREGRKILDTDGTAS